MIPASSVAGAGGSEFVVCGHAPVDEDGGKESGNGDGVGEHGGHEVNHDDHELADLDALLGEGFEGATEGQEGGERECGKEEDPQEFAEDVGVEGLIDH